MPLVGCPKGEKPDVLSPSAVIVTTDRRALAMTSVRSAFWTVVAPVVIALPTLESGVGVGAGRQLAHGQRGPARGQDRGQQRCGEDRREPAATSLAGTVTRSRGGRGPAVGVDGSSGPGAQAYTGSGRMGGYGEVMRQAP